MGTNLPPNRSPFFPLRSRGARGDVGSLGIGHRTMLVGGGVAAMGIAGWTGARQPRRALSLGRVGGHGRWSGDGLGGDSIYVLRFLVLLQIISSSI